MDQTNKYRTFTPEEVADIYQVSKASIYKMIQDGKLLAKKLMKDSIEFLKVKFHGQ